MNVPGNNIERIASALREAERSGVAIAPIAADLKDGGVGAAYAVQAANVAAGLAAGRRLTGRKIGLTSKAVQAQLGVDSPDFGALFADMEIADGETVLTRRVLQPRAEAEIAVVVAKDLDREQLALGDVVSGLAYALPAIEIVGSRIVDWKIGLLDTIADNGSSALYVLGAQPVAISAVDWQLAGMVLDRNGETASLGVTAACLGNPLLAVLWLARTMVTFGTPLRGGDVVMTGALGPMIPVKAGDDLHARIAGLGSVRVRFAE